MNKKDLSVLLMCTFSVCIHAMENQLTTFSSEKKKEVEISVLKKIIHVSKGIAAIVPQGTVLKKKVYLDIQQEEFFTHSTFKELIKNQSNKKLPFILAMVTMPTDQCNKRTINFYSALQLNKALNQNYKKNRYNSSPMDYKDPKNKQPIIEGIKYFRIDPLKNRCKYLASDFDLYSSDKKVRYFTNTYFKVFKVIEEEIENPEMCNYLGEMCNYLGVSYIEGDGVAENLKEGFFWINKAVDKGYQLAEYNFALLHYQGICVEQNNDMAFYWYSKAASKDYAPAQVALAIMHLQGLYGKPDFKMALALLKKAAKQNFDLAIYNLGCIYYEGLCGVNKDYEKAMELFKKAASLGNVLARERLKNNA